MTKNYLKFLKEPSKENFLESRNFVINHEDYSPYSEDLNIIEDFIDNSEFDKAIEHNNINVLLSPRAHLLKKYAFEQKGMEQEVKSEFFFAHRILECIKLTGDGGVDNPYLVIRINDERDFLDFCKESFVSQALIKKEGNTYDVIKVESGREIYFDITACYAKIQSFSLEDMEKRLGGVDVKEKKKWWKFW